MYALAPNIAPRQCLALLLPVPAAAAAVIAAERGLRTSAVQRPQLNKRLAFAQLNFPSLHLYSGLHCEILSCN